MVGRSYKGRRSGHETATRPVIDGNDSATVVHGAGDRRDDADELPGTHRLQRRAGPKRWRRRDHDGVRVPRVHQGDVDAAGQTARNRRRARADHADTNRTARLFHRRGRAAPRRGPRRLRRRPGARRVD
jgi:hypothetical protein